MSEIQQDNDRAETLARAERLLWEANAGVDETWSWYEEDLGDE